MDTAARRHLASDPVMRRLMRLAGPCEIKPVRGRTPYEALLRAVAHQQLTGKAASTILARFFALYDNGRPPKPHELAVTPDEALRTAGFSRAKAAALKDIADKTLDGTIPDRRRLARLGDEAIIERLTTVRGIGRWSVEMFLMFTLARPDVLPVDDYGIRNGYRLAYCKRSLPAPKALATFGQRWSPYRTTAAWYLWRAVDLSKEGRLSQARAPR